MPINNLLNKLILIILLVPILAFPAYAQEYDSVFEAREFSKMREIVGLSEVVEITKIIALENNNESSIGSGYCRIVDSLIFFSQFRSFQILIFDLEGSFVRKIGETNSGHITGLDVYNGEVSILNSFSDRILTYDYLGNLKNNLKIPEMVNVTNFCTLANGDFLIQTMPNIQGKNYALAQISREGEIVEKFLPGESVNFSRNLSRNNVFVRVNDECIRFIPSFGNTIYSYDSGVVKPFIRISPKERVLTGHQLAKYNGLAMNVNNLPGGMWGLMFYEENDNFIRFQYNVSGGNQKCVFIRKGAKGLVQENIWYTDDFFNQTLNAPTLATQDSVFVLDFNPRFKSRFPNNGYSLEAFKNCKIVQDLNQSEIIEKRISDLNIDANNVLVFLKLKNH